MYCLKETPVAYAAGLASFAVKLGKIGRVGMIVKLRQ
jgi:hypothetical protein